MLPFFKYFTDLGSHSFKESELKVHIILIFTTISIWQCDISNWANKALDCQMRIKQIRNLT